MPVVPGTGDRDLPRPPCVDRAPVAALPGRRGDAIRVVALTWAHQLDTELGPIRPAGAPLADALEAWGVAAAAAVRRLGPGSPWETVVGLNGGLIAARWQTARAGAKGGRQAVP